MEPSGRNEIKQTIVELVQNLGTVGLFMLSEARSFLRKSWGASREEFFAAVDQTARTMKQSGKMAAEDIERAAEKIKASWDILNKEKNLDWDTFLTELKSRLERIGDISRQTFDMCVNQAKDVLDKQWNATGRVGEETIQITAATIRRDVGSLQKAVGRSSRQAAGNGQEDRSGNRSGIGGIEEEIDRHCCGAKAISLCMFVYQF